MTTQRTSTDTPRCEFCGGSDIHTLGCWSQRHVETEEQEQHSEQS